MQDLSFVRKMILLVILLVVVLAIFFLQQGTFTAKGPQPTPTPIVASSGNIKITAPFYDGNVGPDFVVQGEAKVPGDIVSIRLSNKIRGIIYYQGIAQVYPPELGKHGPFTAIIHMDTSDISLRPNDRLTLEVFYRAADGKSERDTVLIPLYFSPQLP